MFHFLVFLFIWFRSLKNLFCNIVARIPKHQRYAGILHVYKEWIKSFFSFQELHTVLRSTLTLFVRRIPLHLWLASVVRLGVTCWRHLTKQKCFPGLFWLDEEPSIWIIWDQNLWVLIAFPVKWIDIYPFLIT